MQNGAANPAEQSADAQGDYYLQMVIDVPQTAATSMQQIQCRVESGGKTLANITLLVRLAAGGLPQQ